LTRWFASFKLDQESAANTRRERKLILPQMHGSPATPDERPEGLSHFCGYRTYGAVFSVHDHQMFPCRNTEVKTLQIREQCSRGGTFFAPT
jgi:hypothetical protein